MQVQDLQQLQQENAELKHDRELQKLQSKLDISEALRKQEMDSNERACARQFELDKERVRGSFKVQEAFAKHLQACSPCACSVSCSADPYIAGLHYICRLCLQLPQQGSVPASSSRNLMLTT